MALTCPVSMDGQKLREEVRAMYSRVAANPHEDFHFHRGPEYAVAMLGYDRTELAALPAANTAAFAGLGNPLAAGVLNRGETVLDVGCGAGTDLLLAALRIGPAGKSLGVDMTATMRVRALEGARAMGLQHVQVLPGDAEELPLPDASVDVVISNGALNLATDKGKAYSEIERVLRPGGRIMIADIAVASELDEEIRSDVDLWVE